MGVTASVVVLGQATGVLAAPAAAPTAEVAVTASLQPVLHGAATAAGTGTESIHFSARTVGASGWNLLNDVSVAGRDAYEQLPAGGLSIGQPFEYQIAHCDDTGCTSSAVQTGQVSGALAAGERPGGTRLPFTVGDRVSAQVDAGSGNLLATVNLVSLQRRNGSPLDIGLAYNSRTRAEGFGTSVGDRNSGWRLSTGFDVRLRQVTGSGWVVYYGPNGLTGTFTRNSDGTYKSPAGFKMTLTAANNTWTLYDHNSGDTQHFTAGGQLTELTDRNNNATTLGTAPTPVDSSGGVVRPR